MFALRDIVPDSHAPVAVILDVDGTLVDSNDAHARAWLDVLDEGGHRESYERVRHLIGMGSDKLLPLLTGLQPDSPEGQVIEHRRLEIFTRLYLPYLRPFPGTRALAVRMWEDDKKLIVASSASDELLGSLLDVAGIRDLVEDRASAPQHSKPDPDVVHAALARSGERADRAVMIGDTPYDIEAAARAGIGTIALRCGGAWSEQDLSGALAIYDDPLDLLTNYEDSPLAGRVRVIAAKPVVRR